MKMRSRGHSVNVSSRSKPWRVTSVVFVAAFTAVFVFAPYRDFSAVSDSKTEAANLESSLRIPSIKELTEERRSHESGEDSSHAGRAITANGVSRAQSVHSSPSEGADKHPRGLLVSVHETASVKDVVSAEHVVNPVDSAQNSFSQGGANTIEASEAVGGRSAINEAERLSTGSTDFKAESDATGRADVHRSGNGTLGQGSTCLRLIVYDKPVKTGSTAVTKALKTYIISRGEEFYQCNFASCTLAAKDMCANRKERMHIVEHFNGEDGVINCLGGVGYYRITSVREPLERWESAYLYNQKKGASHYGIHHEESYRHFMESFPDCSLHSYYDGLRPRCAEEEISPDERTAKIVARYDEIIDLYNDDMQGPMHKRLLRYLAEENKSPRPDSNFREAFDHSRLNYEHTLYNALKQKQKELLSNPKPLC